MPASPLHSVLRRLRQLGSDAASNPTVSDRDVLRGYLDGDTRAFETLVQRHGGMVWQVCRRRLGQDADADDACQAVFLALAEKAHSIRRPASLAAWLHGVAYRVAEEIKRHAAERRLREQQHSSAGMLSDPADEVTWREAMQALDEELRQLAEAYRAPLVLCYLEERTRDEAARQLGCSVRTLDRRLERGRRLLRARLERRGFTLPAVLLATGLARQAARASGVTWRIAAQIHTAPLTSVGTLSAGAVSSRVAALAAQVTRRWAPNGRLVAAILLLAGLAAGAGITLFRERYAKLPAADPPPRASFQHMGQSDRREPELAHTDHYGDPLPPHALARLGTLRFRQGNGVPCVAFAPNGKILASGDERGFRLWDPHTGRELRRVVCTHGNVFSLAFSPDGKRLALGSLGRMLWVWNLTTGKEIYSRFLGDNLNYSVAVAYAPDGKEVAAAARGEVLLWNEATGEVRHFNQRGGGQVAAFSPDGKMLATGNYDKTVSLWDRATGRELRCLRGHKGYVGALAFSPDGKYLVSGSTVRSPVGPTFDDTIRLWRVTDGKEVRQLGEHEQSVRALAFSPDGHAIVAGSLRKPIRMWNAATCKELRRLADDSSFYTALVFSPDGKMLAAGGVIVRLWDTTAWKRRRTGLSHEGFVSAVAWSPDGRVAASGSGFWGDGTICLWEPATGRLLRQWRGDSSLSVDALAFAPDGASLASGGGDKRIHLWQATTGKELRNFRGHTNGVQALAFPSDGRYLLSGALDSTVRLWNVASGAAIRQYAGPRTSVEGVAFAEEGRLVTAAECSYYPGGSALHLWETASGRHLRASPGHAGRSVAFAPNGGLLASENIDGTVRLWDVDSGREFARLQGCGQGALAFSPDGQTLAAAVSDAGPMYGFGLWEMRTRQTLFRYTGHQGRVMALAFSPDGRRLLSGSGDTTAMVWDVTGVHHDARVPACLSAEQAKALWNDLAGTDALQAHQAIWRLVESRNVAVAALQARLRPVVAVKPERLAALLADLDSRHFAVRQKASHDLEEMAEQAEDSLRKTLASQPSAEVRRRVRQLLEELRGSIPSGKRLQALRAVEVLEHIGTPAAEQLLQAVARGTPTARLTREARAALGRLRGRSQATRR